MRAFEPSGDKQDSLAAPSLRHENTLLAGQRRVLEMVATGASLGETLDELIHFIEAEEDGLRCGILILTDGVRFLRGAGPNLPEIFHQALDGVPIAPPYFSTCGAAAHQNEIVVVPDVASDTRWSQDWRSLVLSCGFASVRSTPVRGSGGNVLASFAMYYDRPCDAQPCNPELIEIATHLAGIAIERERSARALHDGERRSRELLQALPVAVYTTDAAGRILFYNEAAVDFWGRRPKPGDEWCGSLRLYRPDGSPLPHDECPMALALKEDRAIYGAEAAAERPDGTRVPFLAFPTPLHDENDTLVGAINTLVDIHDRKYAERSVARQAEEQAALYRFTDRLYRADSLAEVYNAALDAIVDAMHCTRASILRFDDAGVMRFVAWRGLSDDYRQAVEGHSPWTTDDRDPQPIWVSDIDRSGESDSLKSTVKAEGIRALAFIPLVANGMVIGKFMTYYERPHAFAAEEIDLAVTIARQLGFSLEQRQAEEKLHRNEARLAAELADSQRLQEISTVLIQEGNPDALYYRIIDAAVGLLRSDAASMQILDRDRGELRLIAWTGFHPDSAQFWEWVRLDSGSTCGAALAGGERVVVPDVEACDFMVGTEDLDFYRLSGIRAVQSTPLVSRSGRLLGMISTHWRQPHQPDDRDLRLLDVLARQAADLIERAHAETALRESEERLRIALSAGKFGNWQIDLANMILTTSDQAKANFGRAPDHPLDYDMFRAALHPHDRGKVATAIGRAIEEIGDYEADFRCIWPDGSTHWINSRGRVLPDESGKAAQLIGVNVDITDRKNAEQRLRLLLDELNHRVKNTMASVQSIAAQTLRSTTSDAEAREAFQSRLLALSGTHDLLTQSHWRGASLRDVLRLELAPLCGEDLARCHLEGPDVHLRSKATVALGMVFHELATNAVKYGALSAAPGKIRVVWEISGGPAEERLRLTWTEQDGPPVKPPRRKGFGSRLIERGLAYELGGDVEIAYDSAGVSCTINIPLATNGEDSETVP